MVAAGAAALVLALFAHPLHTTMTELTVDAPARTVRAVVRVFADDFRRASKGSLSPETYVFARVKLTDAAGKQVSLHSCGTRRTGDLLWICVEGTFSGPERDLRVANALLCDLFDDQVNIVQVVAGAERRSILFTRGDGAKRIS